MVGIVGVGVGVARKRRSLSSWTPAQLGAALALWLDAEDATTITLNGSNVSQWSDRSGNNNNAVQATAASQPAYNATGFNSKPTIQFDGVNDGLSANAAAAAIGSQAFTLLGAIRFPTSASAGSFIITLREASGTTTRGYITRSAANTFNSAWGDPSTSPPSITVADGTNNILGVQRRTGGVVENFANGVAGGSTTASFAQPFGQMSFGAFLSSSAWSDTWFSEVVVATGTMTTTDRQRLEGYLAWKWGGIPQTRAWTPADLGADLALWLDADDASTVTLNGSTVSQWGDKSGNGYAAAQATAASQPTYNSTAYNGKPVLQFDGTSDFLSVGTASLQNTGLNVFVVGDYTDVNYFIGKYDSLSDQREWLVKADRYLIQENLSPFNSAMAADGANQSGKHLIEGIFANGQAAEFWADGSIKGTAALAVNSIEQGTADLQIGKYQTVYSNSDISEVIATSAPITVADRQRLEGYLAHKWGLFANLPADHPYKVAAPTVAI